MKYLYFSKLLACLATWFLLRPAPVLAAPIAPGNLVVVRVGDGLAALTGAATAVFLDEYTPSGTLVQTIDLPTSVSGNNRILTASGNATAQNITRSADGRYLVLTGYGAAPGTTAIAASQTTDVARVIGLIAADGTLDTSTSTGDAFNGASIRAAVTIDGTSFYSVGGSSGVCYQAFGTAMTTQLNTAPTNIRSISAASGNLYISSASSPYYGVSQVGTGLPTAAGQAATVLPGFPGATAGSSPYGFYFADLSDAVPGVDVVYVADDRSTVGGIQKWSLVGDTWVLNGTIAGTAASAVRGLNGSVSGTTVALAAASAKGLFFLSDNTGYNTAPTLTALPEAIATAGTNTVFRGVALAPVAAAPTIVSFTPAAGPIGTTVALTGTDFSGATAVTLNGMAISGFTVVSGTSITFAVPTGASSGAIAVTTPSGTATSTSAFTVTATVPNPAPTIASLAPATAVAGSDAFPLTVNGTGFVAGSVVTFNGTALTTTFVSATQLTAAVPAAAIATAGTLNVTVTNAAPGGGTSATATFTVTVPAPTITSFTPTGGGLGTMVTLTGTNFTEATAVSIGSFAITPFTVVSATSITFVVPDGINGNAGSITVVTPGGTATSATLFNLVLATRASQALPGLKVFPNPATDRLTVVLPKAGAAIVALRDLTGRLVLAPAALPADQQLHLPASLAAGMYLLEVRQGPNVAVRRIQKN